MMRLNIQLVAILAVSSLAFAGNPKVSKDLGKADKNSSIPVIIQFKDAPQDAQAAKVEAKGGKLKKKFKNVKAVAADLPARELEDLADDPDVDFISSDRPVKASLDYSTPATNADLAWNLGYNGTGIGVAVIDSGVKKELKDLMDEAGKKVRVVYAESMIDADSKTDDLYGHGTHVAGILMGTGFGSRGQEFTRTFKGVAPGVSVVSLRVLGEDGAGVESDVIQAIERAIELKAKYNIRIINLSLGGPVLESYRQDPLCLAVEQAWKAGIVVVVAAGNHGRDKKDGNDGYGTITAPGNDPFVITVGAMNVKGTAARGDDVIASYSSKGPTLFDQVVKPDLVAPGNLVASVTSTSSLLYKSNVKNQVLFSEFQTKGAARGSGYFRLSGTSMATPMVSGAVALLLQKNPYLTPDQVKAILMRTATKSFPASSTADDPVTGEVYLSRYDIFTVGAGYLDIQAALNCGQVPSRWLQALSPTAFYKQEDGKVYLAMDWSPSRWGYWRTAYSTSVVWGSSVVWGASVIWGNQAFVDGSSVIWGNHVVWGTAGTDAFSVIWGAKEPEASSVVWGADVGAMNVLLSGDK